MLKSLFFIAIAANIILCVSSTGSKGQCGGRPNESWQQCPNRCAPQNCSQVGNPIACPLPSDSSKCPSKPGCVCNNGYVKNDKGICIPIKNCPSCGGDENAVSGCGACVPTCSNCNSTTPRPCPRICYPNSCDCKKGYVLDENTKKCVEPKNCSPICGQNEEYSPCANGGCHTGRTCDDLKKLNGNEICLNVKKCEQGCLCKKGYLRNKKGVCIPENDCPSRKCSRPNEHYEICPDSCRPSKCSQLGYPISCPETTDNSKCSTKPGCVCDEGYVRNDNGTCIPTQNCPSCGGDEYARSGCGNCPTTCSNYKIKDQIACIQICYANACDCIKDYVLDENTKKCVKIKDCTPQCGQNETYSECINGGCHTGRTCDESMKLNGSTICIKPQKCKKGCLCKDGYVRDSNGVCIPLNDCPYKKCNKENNEHYEICPDDCTPRKCSQLGYPQPCTSLNSGGNGTCSTQPACVCDDGYVRNDKGKCIPSKQCPSCGGDKNAVTGCGNCRKLCRNVGSKEPQICPLFCNLNGCDCREGYVYDENIKKCVLPKDCSQVCGQNEQYTSCIESCAESKCEQKSNAVSDRSGHCTSGCMCRDGFSRNRNGVCVPSNECSLNNKCSKKYQYWDPCPPNCVSETCASIGQVLDCPPQAAVCRPRCRCADGYRIDSQGNCVLESQCNQCGKNETYDYCFNPCPPRECGVNIAAISCLRIEPEDCKGGCRCQDGYLRNKNGDCVAEGDCPPDNPCTKANEVYDVCPSKCPPGVCGIDDTLIDCAPSPLPGDPKCPPPTCKCASGYYRDNKGECVKWEDCPKCPKHEVYDPCGNPCPGELCSTDERVIRCKAPPQIGDEDCVVGCRCQDGYKRNDKGKCVPKDQCPPRCPVNEIYDICPPVCPPQDCSVDETLILCAPNPRPGSKDCKAACRCKDGYKRNSDGVCIPKKECPPKCNGADEVWNPCPNPKDPNTCDSIIAGNDYSNDKTTVRKCKGKCTCKPGYYRNKIGECVAKENCLRCKGPHEYYSCGGACDNVCATLSQQNQTNCPIVNIKCNEKCYCEEGYARDSQNICVPIDTCRCCQGEHEWYDTCPTGCPPNDSCNTYRKAYSCPLQTVPPKCGKPICKCEDNYLRLNGTCVPQEQCPCNGDPNAQPGCGCSKTCSDYYADKPPTCTKICKVDGCDCKEGYVRDTTTGKCVLPKDCPRPTCPKNEIYDLCPASCPPETCPNGRVYKCAAPPKPGSLDCKARCRCKDGYYRDSTGKCIPKDQCPSEQCRGPNESYDPCPDPCALTKCEDLYCTRACATANAGAKQCKGECRCSPGYYRNKIGECIAKENCLKCQGPHEYYSCGGACDNVCATLSQQNQTNCPIINIKCNEKCYCEKQYARDSNGVCIPISSCPPSCNGDPYAEPGCCGQTCANYDPKKTPICNKHCTKDACQCKKGYVLDEVSGKCVLPKNCLSTSCKVNEEYSTCTQAICRHQECTKKGKPVACPGILAGSCLKGCVCKKEYLRLKNGTCVHESLCPTSDPQPIQNRTSDEAALQTLSQGVNIFCFKFFQQALKAKSGQNVIMSPWSVQIPLAQLAIAAESETLKQLLASLNLANKDQIRQAFPLLLDTLKGSDGVTFDKAVRLYINDEFPLLEEYIAISEKVFNATAENVNCRDSTGTANKINKDVESVTNNRIKNLISPDVINDLTRLILVNAIYFKGTWKKQFNVNNTKEQNFYTYDKRTVPVQMMNIETTLEYTKDNTLNAQIVRLTYTDEEYSLVVILPNEKYGFDKTASSLNAETVKAALGNLYKTKVNLYLPKMEINADFELIPILQNLGIVDIFDAAKSNLKGILKIFEPLYVTAAKQKAFFQANEQGTEAAAATAVVASTFSLPIAQPQVIQVKADHPFVFAITAKNNVIFIGNYAY